MKNCILSDMSYSVYRCAHRAMQSWWSSSLNCKKMMSYSNFETCYNTAVNLHTYNSHLSLLPENEHND